jgi:serine/threonine-protein kinase
MLGAAAGALVLVHRSPEPSHEVPDLLGLTSPSANAHLQPLKLQLAVSSSAYSTHFRKGVVMAQDPSSGLLREGSTVEVVLSLGPQPVKVPALSGQSAGAAAVVLHDLGLTVGRRSYSYSMTVPGGVVIATVPDHGALLPGGAVSLQISKGKPIVVVPAIAAGASYADYSASLAHSGLVVSEALYYSNNVPDGDVISATPGPGASVVIGTLVSVAVSRGPHLVAVPNVTSQSVGTATQELSSYGFPVTEVLGNPLGTVTATKPAAGTMALYGSPIVLRTG